jgi:pimeloyl-ACP methyl ester carboxylesterase
LEQAGRDVVTPTLTGLGERAGELSPDIGLSTHVDDVVQVLEQGDLRDVVLVGHSYAGMILPAVAVRAADRLARLVFLDAFVPKDGDSCFDLMPAEAGEAIRQQAQAEGDGWRFPPFPLEALGIVADEDVRWVGPRLSPQPLKTYKEPVPPSTGRMGEGPTHIHANLQVFCARTLTDFEPSTPPPTEDGIATLPGARALWFKDRDGKILNVFERG